MKLIPILALASLALVGCEKDPRVALVARYTTLSEPTAPGITNITVEVIEPQLMVPACYQGRFRVITSNDGLFGVEVLDRFTSNQGWSKGPTYNVFKTRAECQRDIDRWCRNWDTEKLEAARTWNLLGDLNTR